MGFLDKVKEKATSAKDTIKEKASEAKENMQAHKEQANEAKKPLDGSLKWYEVIYGGGLPGMPDKVSSGKGTIGMNVMPDSFYFKPLVRAQEWFSDLEIPYDSIKKFELVNRQVSTAESLMAQSAADAAALATKNTMAITYDDASGEEIYLKMEMLTGLTVNGQAAKCEELMTFLRSQKILSRLNKEDSGAGAAAAAISPAEEIKKFKALLDDGIISQEEFDAKKKQLLGL